MELKHTVELMNSECYKDRFVAEYVQTKIRYEKLKAFNNKIEAAESTQYMAKAIPMPTHDCPLSLLREQQMCMGQYLHILEVRAVIEGIDLTNFGEEASIIQLDYEEHLKKHNPNLGDTVINKKYEKQLAECVKKVNEELREKTVPYLGNGRKAKKKEI